MNGYRTKFVALFWQGQGHGYEYHSPHKVGRESARVPFPVLFFGDTALYISTCFHICVFTVFDQLMNNNWVVFSSR